MTQGAFLEPLLAAVLAVRRVALPAELNVLMLTTVTMIMCHFDLLLVAAPHLTAGILLSAFAATC